MEGTGLESLNIYYTNMQVIWPAPSQFRGEM
jgi:hypothetical protein